MLLVGDGGLTIPGNAVQPWLSLSWQERQKTQVVEKYFRPTFAKGEASLSIPFVQSVKKKVHIHCNS